MSSAVSGAEAQSASVQKPTPAEHILQLATGYIASTAIYIVAKLKIADLLASGPRAVSDLARVTGAHEDRLYRLLRTLASLGVFNEVTPRHFSLTPAGAALDTSRKDSVHPMALWLSDPFHLRIFSELMHTVKTGEITFDHVYGKPIFEYLPEDPQEAEIFDNAMTWLSDWIVPAVLEAYDFSGIGTLMDVAGGRGALLRAILGRYPQMRGIVIDLAHVIKAAKQLPENKAVEDRCQFLVADFFAEVPTDADAIIMKSIIHDWDDESAVRILKNCRTALAGKPNAKILLVDAVIAPGNQPHLAKFIDIEMMVLPGGRERTEEEFRRIFTAAGLRLNRIIKTKSPLCVIEAMPA